MNDRRERQARFEATTTGRIWLGYKDPTGIGHNRSDKRCDAVLINLTVSVDELVREATGDQAYLQQIQAVFEEMKSLDILNRSVQCAKHESFTRSPT
jgi:hypothetical protein